MAGTLEDKLQIGMSYDELVEPPEEPTGVTDGSSLSGESERVTPVAPASFRARPRVTRYCCWNWNEDEIDDCLTAADAKLASNDSLTLHFWKEHDDKVGNMEATVD